MTVLIIRSQNHILVGKYWKDELGCASLSAHIVLRIAFLKFLLHSK